MRSHTEKKDGAYTAVGNATKPVQTMRDRRNSSRAMQSLQTKIDNSPRVVTQCYKFSEIDASIGKELKDKHLIDAIPAVSDDHAANYNAVKTVIGKRDDGKPLNSVIKVSAQTFFSDLKSEFDGTEKGNSDSYEMNKDYDVMTGLKMDDASKYKLSYGKGKPEVKLNKKDEGKIRFNHLQKLKPDWTDDGYTKKEKTT